MKCAALGMTTNQQSPTIAAVRACTDIVEAAWVTRGWAIAKRDRLMAARCAVIATQLDATRTRLVQDGPEYIDTAWAMIDAARVGLANVRRVLA